MSEELQLPRYPVSALQSELCERLEENRIPVIQAPPGSGKSTLIPLYLLQMAWRGEGTIVLLQPRRPAVRSLAARLRELSRGQAQVGFITRYERSVPEDPDILVITEGILTRRLPEDPALEGTAAVILDEFHERSLSGDLAYVLARQCRDIFRPDLRLLIMSATLDPAMFSEEIFSVLQAEGTLHPLTVEYHPPPARSREERHGAGLCRRWLKETDSGSLLYFLPGEAEIRRAAEELSALSLPDNVQVHSLYGRLSPREQSRALAPPAAGMRKVVLATNIAETSLTIEDVHCVVDSGLQRRSRWDPDTGLNRLETERISTASAQQRAGRAGRIAPGTVFRLWEKGERLREFDPPEIRTADLSGLFLTLALWGDTDGTSCPWPDPPEERRREEALALLRQLEAIDEKGVPTAMGAAMARLPVAPRLAAMLLETGTDRQLRLAALTAGILEHGDPLPKERAEEAGADLEVRLDQLEGSQRGSGGRILQEARRLEQLAGKHRAAATAAVAPSHRTAAAEDPGTLLLGAYPDRIAMRTERGRYLLPSGVEAILKEGNRGFAPAWIVAGAMHRRQREGIIYLAAALPEDTVEDFVALHGADAEELILDEEGLLYARRRRRLGAVTVSSTPVQPADVGDAHEQCLQLIRSRGTEVLPFGRGAVQLRARLAFLHAVRGDPWPDVSDASLLQRLEEWLLPFLPRRLHKHALRQLPLTEALRSLLPWELLGQLDQLAPEQLSLPSGSRRRLRYEGQRCILSARIQQLFSMTDTPEIAGVPLEVELLSPAGRPMQVTSDLRSFWERTYPEVRRELRGRYPKHYWPEDPFSAAPTDRLRPEAR
jgi:ATP-dependent helicase HrpB